MFPDDKVPCASRGKVALQFHIAGGSEAQRTPLPIKLVLPDHASLLERLELVKASLEKSDFRFEQKGDLVAITDPFGQHFEVHQPSQDDVYDRGIKDILLPCAPGTAQAIGAFYEKFYKVGFLDPASVLRSHSFLTAMAAIPTGEAMTSSLSLDMLTCMLRISWASCLGSTAVLTLLAALLAVQLCVEDTSWLP